MEVEAKSIIIDRSIEEAEVLQAKLLPELKLTGIDIRKSLLKGIHAFREEAFDVCFISDGFDEEEVKAFFSDVKTLSRENGCVFVQVRDSVKEGFNRTELRQIGFDLIISRKINENDKSALCEAVIALLSEREIKRKVFDVDMAVKLIVAEIDRVWKDRLRGVKRSFTRTMLSDFMVDEVGFHADVLEGYLAALEKYTQTPPPDMTTTIAMPEELVDLPGFKDGSYSGVSLRVWEMLKDRYGREKRPSPEDKKVETEEAEVRDQAEEPVAEATSDAPADEQSDPQ